MKEINWNEAPKGTTHCDTGCDRFPWMKLSHGLWYMYNTKGRWSSYKPTENELTYFVKKETTVIV